MIQELKTKIYSLLSDLGYQTYDNPYTIEIKNRKLPYVQIRTADVNRLPFRGCFMNAVEFKIDVWSKYNGEKEVLEIENQVAAIAQQLYELDYVSFVSEKSCQILDDKTTGPVLKHMIMTWEIVLQGKEE